jgi:hypothetical protein
MLALFRCTIPDPAAVIVGLGQGHAALSLSFEFLQNIL